jgi:hypothetical protein
MHRARLEHLESCFQREVAKSFRERSASCLLFLWQEMGVHRVVIKEMEDLEAHSNGTGA